MPTYEVGYNETLSEGSYPFVVIDANEKQSQSGNEMIELQLLVKGPNGNELRVFDHLVFTPKSYWKIDAFRVATGEKLVPGQTVSLEPEDCVDREGKVFLTVEKFEGRERNKVQEYLAAEKLPPAQASSQTSVRENPFPKAEETLEEEFARKGAKEDDDIPMA
jgi:uncharacterized protein DUF669